MFTSESFRSRTATPILLAAVGTLCLGCGKSEGPVADRPNVLMIAVDDLNDWIGCLGGHPQAVTPNMDRLAARGLLFTNAHCAAPACNPSRAALFSGLMPQSNGVWANDSAQRLERTLPDARLLPTMFREAGYTVLGTGKLLHSGGKDLFDDYFSVEQRWSPLSREKVDYTPEELPTKGTRDPRHLTQDSLGWEVVLPLNRMPSDRRPNQATGESFDWGPFDVPDEDFGDTQITNWAIRHLVADHPRPFFLAVGFYRPHIPLWAPKRFFDRFANEPGLLPEIQHDDLDDLGESATTWAREPVTAGRHATVVEYGQWTGAVEAYLASVSYIDYEIGRLLDALGRSTAADETLIILWSDHGWHLGEKEHWGKWTGWERSTRVPVMIAPPSGRARGFATGSTSDQPVSLIDVYPTLAELCGLTPPDTLDGESLVPLLHDPETVTGRAVVTMFSPGNGSLRTHRWRYIRYADGSEELYDHANDPNEWNNLAGARQYAGQLEALRQRMEPYVAE